MRRARSPHLIVACALLVLVAASHTVGAPPRTPVGSPPQVRDRVPGDRGTSLASGLDLDDSLARIGHHVEHYYARARSIVCIESVHLQPLSTGLSPEGFMRQLVYELRVNWEPSADGEDPSDATVVRQLISVNGRPPKANDAPGCIDPRPVSPEPLAMLLPDRQHQYAFTWAGMDRIDGRHAMRLDYRSMEAQPASVSWKGDCVSVDLPGRTRGRLWVDAETDDVLRLDERLTGMFEFPVPADHRPPWAPSSMIIERADSSIRYRPVAFHDPDETLMLPESIQSLTLIRNSGVPRLRTTQRFSSYKRFLTAGRLKDPSVR